MVQKEAFLWEPEPTCPCETELLSEKPERVSNMCCQLESGKKKVYLWNCSTEESGTEVNYMEMPNFNCAGNSEHKTEESRKSGVKVKGKLN